ncbi:MvdC/MvdD family ATP grasp protein [Nocardiopsis rhodophaea]|uniref:MvdC/MvdD family ATP grasp protein n=1 Tax=Nocardiopsis rhodophaea TaxID=280238 RepID=UPI0031D295C3
MTVLVLAHPSDNVADCVAEELEARRTAVVRLNPSAFPQRLRMAARLADTCRWSGTLTADDGEVIELDAIRAVWRRSASQFVLDDRMTAPERAFAYGEARRGFGGVLAALGDCLWVNDPVAAASAEYKPVQLAAASEIGLCVPETLITSDPQAAHDWAKELGRPIVYKPMSGVWHADEGQLRLMYTTPIADPGELLDPHLSLTAQMLQERVPLGFAVRATVVGDRVFAARIDTDSLAAQEDWRSDYEALHHSVIELPGTVATALVDLHRRLGLVYGAADLIYDDISGRFVFLETNQNGEFGWIAHHTGLPIPAAIADLLERA